MSTMSTTRTLILLILAFLLWPATALAADGPDTSLCVQCHSSVLTGSGHVQVADKPGVCLECHAPHSSVGSPALATPPMDRCVGCHSRFGTTALSKDQQAGDTVHKPVLDQNCGLCHLPHTSFDPPGFVGGDKNASCVSCHANTMQAGQLPSQHPPFAEGSCTSCHDPHVTKEHTLLKGPVADLCYMCHDGDIDRGQMPVQHKPFADGKCTDCHSGHASANPDNLLKPTSQLCVDCHVPQDGNKKYPHGPYATGDCTLCHAPHSSQTAALVTADSQHDLCLSCHGGSGQPAGPKPSHPLSQTMRCTGCHSPHSSDTVGVPGGGDLTQCTACHTTQATHFANSPHGSCTACHAPHGSSEPQLPTGSPNDLCWKCHITKPHGEHPVGGSTVDPNTGKPVSCVSCHDPHGSPYPHSLVQSGDGLCLTCHNF